jgi:hypothetical protein
VLHGRLAAIVLGIDHDRRADDLRNLGIRGRDQEAHRVAAVDLVRDAVLEHGDFLGERVDLVDPLEIHHDLADDAQGQRIAHEAAREVVRGVVGIARPEVAHDESREVLFCP